LTGGARSLGALEAAGALLASVSPVPIVLVEGPMLPGFAGEGTLVAVCAASALEWHLADAVATEAMSRGAVAVVAGLKGHVNRAHAPLPASETARPQITSGLLELLPALLALAEGLDLAPQGTGASFAGSLASAARTFKADSSPLQERLARRIGRTIPVFEGARGVGAVAARSWRRAWNLLAKAPALSMVEPGASFEEIAGFGQHGDVTRQLLTLVSLRTGLDPAEDVARSQLFVELAGEAFAGALDVVVPGEDGPAALAQLEWLGLATASARAVQEGLDPDVLPIPGEVEARLGAAISSAGAGTGRGGDGAGSHRVQGE
jgi:glucose/mannose-6-phosphate isomerase